MDLGILFLGGAKRVSVANHLIEAGKALGYGVRIFSYELEEEVPVATVGTVIPGLKWSDPGIIDHLEAVIGDNRIDMVLPFVDSALDIAARLKEKLPEVFIPVSPRSLCADMFDKVIADSLFESKGIPIPENLHGKNRFPQIWKPRTGSASSGIIIVKDESGLPDLDREKYLIQEYIANAEEFTVDCYVSSKGEITSVVPRLRMATAGGEVVKSVTLRDYHIMALSNQILGLFPFRGPVTLQFLRDCNGRTLLMEINPRLGGGVVTSIAAGSKILEMLILESIGQPVSPIDTWRENTLITRYFQETVFYDYKPKS